MIVLHAGICDGQLLLWGETPAEPRALAPKRNGRKSTKDSHTPGLHPQPLPYDAGSEGLVAALQEAGLGSTADRKHTQTVIAWLPTIDNQPVASSPLIAEPPQSRKTPTVAPWTVTALPLTTAQAVGVLCACAGKPMLAPGVSVGKDVLFWATVMRFAGALVARQQFLPEVKEIPPPHPGPLAEGKSIYRACWKPVFIGADADRLAKLARTMPQACRALTREAISPPERPVASVLSDFTCRLVDHLVRFSVAPVEHVRQKRSPSFDSVHDQWVHALRSSEGTLRGDAAALAELPAQLRAWQRPLSISAATALHLCSRWE